MDRKSEETIGNQGTIGARTPCFRSTREKSLFISAFDRFVILYCSFLTFATGAQPPKLARNHLFVSEQSFPRAWPMGTHFPEKTVGKSRQKSEKRRLFHRFLTLFC